MKVIVQRSLESMVLVDSKIVGKISHGLVLLVGFNQSDTISDINYIINKIINLRIFDDKNHIMNKSIKEIGGSILSISQFTLYADTSSGNRPSYIKAMKADKAKEMYELFNQTLSNYLPVETGMFGSNMEVKITNDGPVTIVLESRICGDKKQT